jgi:hypothetical protein
VQAKIAVRQVKLPGEDVTMYVATGAIATFCGADHVRLAEEVPVELVPNGTNTLTERGSSGGAISDTALEGVDGIDDKTPARAVTVKV